MAYGDTYNIIDIDIRFCEAGISKAKDRSSEMVHLQGFLVHLPKWTWMPTNLAVFHPDPDGSM